MRGEGGEGRVGEIPSFCLKNKTKDIGIVVEMFWTTCCADRPTCGEHELFRLNENSCGKSS